MDNSIKSAEEIESFLGIPALAIIPAALSANTKRLGRAGEVSTGKRPLVPTSAPALSVLKQPRSPVAEAYRALRTSILLSVAKRGPYTLLITSANSNEGKTSTAINLATALGQSGASVLLVDCDLRKPGISHILDLDGRKGISTILAGRHTLDEALQNYDALSNLWVLPAGPVAASPAEMLSTPAAEKLLSDLRDRFTYIVIDSPPLLAVTDATILSTFVDGVLLVVEGGVTPRRAVARARKMLAATGVRIMGVALNKIDSRHGAYYGYYGRSYSYGELERTESEAPIYAFQDSGHSNGNGNGLAH
jgi:capsular exopolysaccharide synthesis family protein